ncbi:hypothetical protein GWI33_018070 [Rhynchophorus ferrugineus]|uniref:Uncharacterized protein n=1 Tax=Rhynchophorus ferrugineus TaxID=354439 RepID=A0A834HWV0_RHYFE|nr:hypothetical protein GWI33_018070 [Rhynchophorus ferrugineus]
MFCLLACGKNVYPSRIDIIRESSSVHYLKFKTQLLPSSALADYHRGKRANEKTVAAKIRILCSGYTAATKKSFRKSERM